MNKVVSDFFKLYEDELHTQFKLKWMGINIIKCPFDLWNYQEIIFDTKPDIIVECGTFNGGSALYFANLLDIIGNGTIFTIDTVIHSKNLPIHNRIKYFYGSSIDFSIFNKISDMCKDKKVMVILDSDHHKNHVLKEMELYSNIVSVGCYMIVEDGCVNGNPIYENWGEGPFEAINDYLINDDRFIIDKQRENKFLMTYHPNGWLKRIK